MSGNFPPDYFSPDYFAPEYFGGEVNANAMSATIAGVATVTATLTSGQVNIQASLSGSASVVGNLTVAAAQDQDFDSHWEYARVKKKARKPKAQRVVVGVLAAKIVGRSGLLAVGEAPRVAVPGLCYAEMRGIATISASLDGPDRIEERDLQDLEDLVDLYMLMAA